MRGEVSLLPEKTQFLDDLMQIYMHSRLGCDRLVQIRSEDMFFVHVLILQTGKVTPCFQYRRDGGGLEK